MLFLSKAPDSKQRVRRSARILASDLEGYTTQALRKSGFSQSVARFVPTSLAVAFLRRAHDFNLPDGTPSDCVAQLESDADVWKVMLNAYQNMIDPQTTPPRGKARFDKEDFLKAADYSDPYLFAFVADKKATPAYLQAPPHLASATSPNSTTRPLRAKRARPPAAVNIAPVQLQFE